MPHPYDQIRDILRKGFGLDNLRLITTHSLSILRDDPPQHPATLVLLAAISRWIADAWDGVPLSVETATRVEQALAPHFQSLINVANGDLSEVCEALDAASTAFRGVILTGLDCSLG
jgi:hypothetical protein